jgi:hypothetical protein
MKPTAKHHEDFIAQRSIPGVAFKHNAPVVVINGAHVGASGSVMAVQDLGSDPLYLVELASGQDALVRQSSLQPLGTDARHPAPDMLRIYVLPDWTQCRVHDIQLASSDVPAHLRDVLKVKTGSYVVVNVHGSSPPYAAVRTLMDRLMAAGYRIEGAELLPSGSEE